MSDIINETKELFKNEFHQEPSDVFSCGGRFEILGNHTDHNHGLCLAATCNLAITASLRKRDDMIVNFFSKGYRSFTIDLNDLSIHEDEKNSSAGLCRGVAAYLKEHGYNIGGFDAYSDSTIFAGAGVSSSAAFELLVAGIFNHYFNDNSIDRMVLCKAGQYGENNYFGKKSGLLDQIGVGYGNIVSIDFKNIEKPVVSQVKFPFEHLHFVIVNTGGSHAELSDLYSSIPQDMYNAAKKCGHNFLREGSFDELIQNKDKMSDMEYRRGLHFYSENERVAKALEAIENKDEALFLKCINESRLSSTNYLKNMMVENNYEGSPLEACDLIMKVTNNEGACKINGGGFAGSVICVIPDKHLNNFIKVMSEKYGDSNVKEVFVRKTGPIKE